MKISACLIAKNESENIARCLESLKNVADEITVVDTGSTDHTVDIAKQYGAKIYHYNWDNNFSNAKNFTLGKAEGNWIIFLDADEYLDINTQKILPKVLKNLNSDINVDGVECKMIHTDGFNGRILGENPILRMFKKDQIQFFGAIHEKPLKDGNPPRCPVGSDYNLIIYHTGYKISVLLDKYKRNLALLENQEKTNDINHLTYYYLSVSHSNLGHPQLAIKYALLSLKESLLKTTPVAYKPYVILVRDMLKLKDIYPMEEIEQYLNQALNLYPYIPEVRYMEAIFKKTYGDYQGAINSYLKSLGCQQNFDGKMLNDFPGHIEEVYGDLAHLNRLLDNTPDALEYYYQALKINKYNAKSLTSLFALIKEQKIEEIVFFLNSIYNKDDEKNLTFLCKVLINLNEQAAGYYYKLWDVKFNNK